MTFRRLAILALMAVSAFLSGCAGVTNNPKETAVVIVGMSNSKVYGKCVGSATDVKNMRKILAPYTKNLTVLEDANATRANVRAALIGGATKKTLIFYYSGHGGQVGHGDSSETDGKNEHLCLYDGAFMDDELWSVACASRGKVMYIIDACHSETMYRSLPEQFDATARTTRGSTPNLLCWSGCTDEQFSYGVEGRGGFFTQKIAYYYEPKMTYDALWKKVSYKYIYDYGQTPMRTKIGKGWNTFVFH